MMSWIGRVCGPFTRVEVHDEEGLGDEEKDGEEEEGGAPDPAGKREAGVGVDAIVPEAGPAGEDDKAPEGVKDR